MYTKSESLVVLRDGELLPCIACEYVWSDFLFLDLHWLIWFDYLIGDLPLYLHKMLGVLLP